MITATIKRDGKEVSIVQLDDKVFSTGSRGYHTSKKIELDDKRYQLNFMLVEIGSKTAQ